MYPVLLNLGPVTIYSYGVMMALSFVAAGWVISTELERQGRDPELASTLVLWAAVGGLLGARILFILDAWQAFMADPWSLIFTGAGFIWYGGLIGGVIGVTLCIRHYKLPWLTTMDMVGPGIALGHGIGRIGCHLAGDGDWGPETSLPWGMIYSKAIIGWPYEPGVAVHPTPLYEMVAYVLIFAFLWSRRTTVQRPGVLFWGYLVLSGLARFGLEFVRVNPPLLLGLSMSQVISVPLIAIGAYMLVKRDTPDTRDAATNAGQPVPKLQKLASENRR
jgi:phosphatidylglycerol:prolipoprotein diacylglycerol transferase